MEKLEDTFAKSTIKVFHDFTFFPFFSGLDVLIQCIFTTTHSLANQAFFAGATNYFKSGFSSEEEQWSFYQVTCYRFLLGNLEQFAYHYNKTAEKTTT